VQYVVVEIPKHSLSRVFYRWRHTSRNWRMRNSFTDPAVAFP